MPTWPGDDSPMSNGRDDSRHARAAPPPGYGQARAQPQEQSYLPVPTRYEQPLQQQAQTQGQMQYRYVQPRNPALGLICSLLIPGLGSMINEKVGKGIGILACYFVALVSCVFIVGFILAPAVWIWGMVAGYGDAKMWNQAHGILS